MRFAFDEDAANYDRWRPRYCEALFSDVIAYSRLNGEKRAVEIGCGTGQATEPFLKTGCAVTAIEHGGNLAAFVRKKFGHYRNFQVQNIGFEKFQFARSAFDLVYAATAFHWIPEEIGYRNVYDMLKSGGTVALFWNRPFVARDDNPLHRKIQSLYEKYASNGERSAGQKPVEDDAEKYRRVSSALERYGFVDIECRIYRYTRTFCAQDYVSLLNTYSDHRAMRLSARVCFEEEIKAAIDEFGGTLDVFDTMDLHLGRKP